MEYGLCNCLKIYSGGLGVLAGDYIKQASDSRVNMTAVGFLYRFGYFSQSLSINGQQVANYEPQNFEQLPIDQVLDENGQPMILEVPYPGRIVYAHIWRVNVGRMKLYLLDTDFDRNSEFDRQITHKLYGGDWENRIKQEYLLGIGGVLMLNKLGIKLRHVYGFYCIILCKLPYRSTVAAADYENGFYVRMNRHRHMDNHFMVNKLVPFRRKKLTVKHKHLSVILCFKYFYLLKIAFLGKKLFFNLHGKSHIIRMIIRIP